MTSESPLLSVPTPVSSAEPASPMSCTEALVRILRRPIGDPERRRAALHVLDWIGCAALGSLSETGAVFRHLAERSPAGPSWVWGGHRVGPRDAALVNGAFGSVLEMDDTYRAAILHPGPVVVPASLAVVGAEPNGGGHAFLDAIVRGYEAMIRLGCAVGPEHYRFYHKTGSCGPFGSAAAAGDLMGLSDTELVSALGNAGTQSSGLWQCRHEQVATKHFHVARACQSGYVAAELASLGFAGPRFILEGPQGLFAATAPDADPTALVAQADGPWRLMGTSVKPWPACRHTHPAIDAALALRPAIAGREIEGVIISGTRDAAAFCDRTHPTTPGEARFSLQHAVAATLIHGAPELWAFEPPAIAQADIATLRARSVVLVGEDYEARYPARFGGGVVVRLRDGGELEASIPDALGDPENPLPEERLVGKAATLLAEAGFGSARIDAVVANARALADDRPVEGLIASLAEGWPVRLAS